MVVTPYIEKQRRNYKTGKNKIRDKKSKAQQSKTYHVFEALLCWWQKYGEKHNKPMTKKRVRQANKPTERNLVMGQKDHFMETWYKKKKTHTYTQKNCLNIFC